MSKPLGSSFTLRPSSAFSRYPTCEEDDDDYDVTAALPTLPSSSMSSPSSFKISSSTSSPMMLPPAPPTWIAGTMLQDSRRRPVHVGGGIRASPFEALVHERNLPKSGTISPLTWNEYDAWRADRRRNGQVVVMTMSEEDIILPPQRHVASQNMTPPKDDNDETNHFLSQTSLYDAVDNDADAEDEDHPAPLSSHAQYWKGRYLQSEMTKTRAHTQIVALMEERRQLRIQVIELQAQLYECQTMTTASVPSLVETTSNRKEQRSKDQCDTRTLHTAAANIPSIHTSSPYNTLNVDFSSNETATSLQEDDVVGSNSGTTTTRDAPPTSHHVTTRRVLSPLSFETGICFELHKEMESVVSSSLSASFSMDMTQDIEVEHDSEGTSAELTLVKEQEQSYKGNAESTFIKEKQQIAEPIIKIMVSPQQLPEVTELDTTVTEVEQQQYDGTREPTPVKEHEQGRDLDTTVTEVVQQQYDGTNEPTPVKEYEQEEEEELQQQSPPQGVEELSSIKTMDSPLDLHEVVDHDSIIKEENSQRCDRIIASTLIKEQHQECIDDKPSMNIMASPPVLPKAVDHEGKNTSTSTMSLPSPPVRMTRSRAPKRRMHEEIREMTPTTAPSHELLPPVSTSGSHADSLRITRSRRAKQDGGKTNNTTTIQPINILSPNFPHQEDTNMDQLVDTTKDMSFIQIASDEEDESPLSCPLPIHHDETPMRENLGDSCLDHSIVPHVTVNDHDDKDGDVSSSSSLIDASGSQLKHVDKVDFGKSSDRNNRVKRKRKNGVGLLASFQAPVLKKKTTRYRRA